MLLITLGTQASGSTWLFNVALMLFEAAGTPIVSMSAENGLDALDRMPNDVQNVVVKTHAIDLRLLRIARLADARVIVSTRDPRDSVVSQKERFGVSTRHAIAELSKAFATIRSLPDDIPTLRFAYEDGFTNSRKTIDTIARFLGLKVGANVVDRIFRTLQPAAIQARIKKRLSELPPDVIPFVDPDTQWHPEHVGDGRVSKWKERLDDSSLAMVEASLMALWSQEKRKLLWSAELFAGPQGIPETPVTRVEAAPNKFVAYGPYLHLPRGRWRVTPRINLVEGSVSVQQIEADVFLPWPQRQVCVARGRVSPLGADGLALRFDHSDYFQPVELRLRATAKCNAAWSFGGWEVEEEPDLPSRNNIH